MSALLREIFDRIRPMITSRGLARLHIIVLVGASLLATGMAHATSGATDQTAIKPNLVQSGQVTSVPAPGSAQNPCWIGAEDLLYTLWPSGYNSGLAQLWTTIAAGGNGNLLVGDADSTNVNLPGSCYNASSDRIVFSRESTDNEEIWTVRPSGASATLILAEAGANLIEPSWSPDGQWIVFERSIPPAEQGAIWKVRSDGTGAAPLTDGTGNDRQPNWSPAGDRILFQSQRTGDWEIWTMDPDGGTLLNVTQDPAAEDTDASFSPDGSLIVFSSDHGGLPLAKLFIVPSSGGTPIRVTSATGSLYEGAPSWSGDGQWISYESCTGDPDAARTQLWIAETPTSVLTPAMSALVGIALVALISASVLVSRRPGAPARVQNPATD